MSDYITGADIHAETFFAQSTLTNSFWNRAIFHPYNGMVSITVLPVFYVAFLNFDVTGVYTLAYPLIYLLVPLVLYYVYRKQTSPLIAFISVFFFMSMDTFYVQMLGLARQMIGELFFALLLLVIVNETISIAKKRILFLVLGVGLIFSHYSLAYLFLFLMLVAFSISSYFKNAKKSWGQLITGKLVFAYTIALVSWYLFVVPAASKTFADALGYIYNALISNVSGPGVGGLMPAAVSPLRQMSQYLFYILQFLVIIGIIALVVKRKKSQFNSEYAGMSIASLLILLSSIVLPNFAASLNISRFYHLALFLLAPFCITGIIFFFGTITRTKLLRRFTKRRRKAFGGVEKAWIFVTAVLLLCLFLFQVGFIYEITRETPTSIPLSSGRVDSWTIYMHQLYVDQQEVFASKWLAQYGNNNRRVYADSEGTTYLTSYGLVSSERLSVLAPSMSTETIGSSYIFFDKLNVVNNMFVGYGNVWNSTEFSSILNASNKIYSNGASDMYCGLSP